MTSSFPVVMAGYSIYTGQKKTFSVADYVLFGLTLAISAGIGLFYAIKDRNHLNSANFLLGNRNMYVIPVSMSLLVTYVSALLILGAPAEMYNYTTMFWWLGLSFGVAVLITARVFIPFFYNLRMTSVFQYLEMRFNKRVRVFGSVIFIFQTCLYMALVLYAPVLALNAVTGIDLWASVISVGAAVTLYTALGGMKAVLWTDTFQALIIATGLLVVLVQGSIVVGGFHQAWDIASNRSRINFHDFSFNPSTRHSFWSVVVGGTFFWLSLYGVNQSQVQRALSCPTITKAQIALWINIPTFIYILSLCCMIGIVMHAFYADCHPLKFNELITKTDQLLPLFVMDILGDIPGFPGVFVSCVFSGSLSTLSSGLNALGAVIPHDLILPYCCKKLSDRNLTILSKTIVVIFGGLVVALAFLVSHLGSLMQAAMSIISILNGPVLGLFVFGMFFPWANVWGALIGGITSLVFMSWVAFGAFVNKASKATLSPVYVHGCNWNVTTTVPTVTTTLSAVTTAYYPDATTTEGPPLPNSSDPFKPLYSMSYLYYTPAAMAVLIIVGMFVSLITGKTDSASLDPRLICPLFDRLFPCLPEYILRPLRCGVNHNQKYTVDSYIRSDLRLNMRQLETHIFVDHSGDTEMKQTVDDHIEKLVS